MIDNKNDKKVPLTGGTPAPAAYAEGGDVAAPVAAAPVDPTPVASPEAPAPSTVPVYDISGEHPVLGTVPHSDVHEAISSGQYAFPKGTTVPAFNPEGKLGDIPAEEAHTAFNNGYKYATPDDIDVHTHSGAGQQLLTGIEGGVSGLISRPLTSALEIGSGLTTGHDIEARQKANPWTAGLSEAGGLAVGMFTGTGEAALLAKAGSLVPEAAEAASLVSKIGSATVRGAIENMVFQGGEELAKVIQDPSASTANVATHIGLAGLIGGGVGGTLTGVGVGVVSPLWEAVSGSKTGQFLRALADKAGGIEGEPVRDAVDELLDKAGITMSPEIRAGLSKDPQVVQAFRTLSQSDTTRAGLKFQTALSDFHQTVGDVMVSTLGRSADEVAGLANGIAKSEYGKKIGNQLADEFGEQTTPLSEAYEGFKSKYRGADLAPSISSKLEPMNAELEKATQNLNKLSKAAAKAQSQGDVEGAIEAAAKVQDAQTALKAIQMKGKAPGTSDILNQRLAKLAEDQGWTVSPSSDIMKAVTKAQKELPNLRTLNQLSDYIKSVGDNMQSDPLNKSLMRAGSLVKQELRNEEARIIGNHIGSNEGAEVLSKYGEVRQAYAKQSELRESLDSRLRTKGSTAGYAKSLREMAGTDGERIVNNLNGKGDANILEVLQKSFPKTAELVKQYHLDTVLSGAAKQAKEGQLINPGKLLSGVQGLSPEIRSFAMTPESTTKLGALSEVLNKLKDPNHNFSNSARVIDSLLQDLPGSVLGIASSLSGHDPLTSALVAGGVKVLGKEAPDAVRLGLLKFMGSNKPINSAAFKATVDYINHAAQGAALTKKVVGAVFSAGDKVLPAKLMPDPAKRSKLDAQLKAIQSDPSKIAGIGGNIGHYLPDHATALGTAAGSAATYLNNLRPKPAGGLAFDSKLPPEPGAQAQFNRALDIANQPLTVLHSITKGTLTPEDVKHLNATNPDAYQHLCKQLTSEMTEHVNKGRPLPYTTRLQLSMFLGQPLDSTMTPSGIMGAQPQAPQGQPQTPQMPASGNKSSTKSLGGLAKQSRTLGQSREERTDKV